MSSTPPAEIEIDDTLVRDLLTDQHSDLADRSLTLLGAGWDNAMYRLGDDLVVRLPRRQAAAILVEHEQRWLPPLAGELPLTIPAPVRIGVPGRGYPWAWSVLPWIDGAAAGVKSEHLPTTADQRSRAATELGRFLASLHRPAPPDAPINAVRGIPLAERASVTAERFAEAFPPGGHREPPILGGDLRPLPPLPDPDELATRWGRALDQPPWAGTARWLHGDLHAMNILVDRGRIVAVIDFGDITSGDPATDLAIGFSLFTGADRARFRAAADRPDRPIDEAMWRRAEGWAISVGLTILVNSADNPAMYRAARAMIAG